MLDDPLGALLLLAAPIGFAGVFVLALLGRIVPDRAAVHCGPKSSPTNYGGLGKFFEGSDVRSWAQAAYPAAMFTTE
jgi:hypothetical protein